MKLSINGIKQIEQFEGVKLKPYQDIVGIWTYGIGAIRDKFGKPVTKLTPPLTLEGAEALFITQVKAYEDCVNKFCIARLNQNQFDALVSLVYNIGQGNFMKSTILRKLNNGETPTQENWLAWNKAGGIVSKGLTNRRLAEYKLFTRPC